MIFQKPYLKRVGSAVVKHRKVWVKVKITPIFIKIPTGFNKIPSGFVIITTVLSLFRQDTICRIRTSRNTRHAHQNPAFGRSEKY